MSALVLPLTGTAAVTDIAETDLQSCLEVCDRWGANGEFAASAGGYDADSDSSDGGRKSDLHCSKYPARQKATVANDLILPDK